MLTTVKLIPINHVYVTKYYLLHLDKLNILYRVNQIYMVIECSKLFEKIYLAHVFEFSYHDTIFNILAESATEILNI